ncbi:hypothetical protein G9444_6426 [Rhodococcus erythropolis]|uniref:Abi-like protein n=2 Tax=Rhodococcus erythropolis group TaxID=2840174 RepID=A0A6G9D3A7_RHOER|nr:hypothetical protein [Rhodococcus erythropolis]QIP43669.1 hypothetical protein G9444_6426 [Rhodococcus erythropolis]
MDPAEIHMLPAAFSQPRFQTFLNACDGDVKCAMRLYSWNIELSGAFWGPLHVLEIVMRNVIHSQLASKFKRDDWWEHPDIRFSRENDKDLKNAKASAEHNARGRRRAVRPTDVMSSLNFAFWTSLTGPGGSAQYETKLWQPAIVKAFPRLTGTRADLNYDLNYLRLLRNRIAHHEPIFNGDHLEDRQKIINILHYANEPSGKYVAESDRIRAVLSRREAALAGDCSF